MNINWTGVMPAITTCFDDNLNIDHEFTARHVSWLVDHGCTGIVTNGSIGEGGTFTLDEKVALWKTCVSSVGDRVPIVAAIASMTTADAIAQAKSAEAAGCRGLMVLPPYIYRGDWREMKQHISQIVNSTPLSCMLYNNPVAYGTDFLPEQMAELAGELPNLHSVKESSTDVRRVTAIRALCGDRLKIFVGVDDVIVEGINAGASGWIAGVVGAFPKESVDLYNYAMNGETEKARELYEWLLPLLRLDTVPKFVQLIKLIQERVGWGSTRVRPPRLALMGAELDETLAIIDHALATRP
ncbi:MAG TPA: dihydrodipicolinate synthase family protein [Pyrinomonadaceae bacterium]|nr:dihydrodipicolinate synthase family protein [Chloracidobacterium sp.]MBP9934933.1 dihydrodipicolinate synthase family protein [Pyrinomonadaceae bacterium]MBK7803360.1 dihydrodipicolinate synthase family protein [Chloracidobacterium sp.]MBK9438609.1 dihydrodipicolinate synthase family protein [Chloracidobacterium sp.]MBK9766658.1 dihydrodipicolinate synthase family protein [Chloracidobacterium sp.]